MEYLLAPAACELPGPFELIDAPETIDDAAALLERFGAAASGPGPVTPVLATPQWPSWVFGPRRAELPEHARVLLVPDGNVWGFTAFARALAKWPSVACSGPIGPDEARDHVTQFGKIAVDEGILVERDRDTLRFLQQRAAAHPEAVAAVRALLADEESRATYDRLIYGTLSDLFEHYVRTVGRTVQYFECLRWSPGMVIVNGGVQEGFELPYFAALTGGDLRVISADPSGFDRLSGFARPIVEALPGAFVEVREALWSHGGRVRLPITDDGTVLSQYKDRNLHHFEEVEFPCTSVDGLVAAQRLERVDLVKLDVEGAEPAVIDGMTATLARHRPQLAISIYHWPEHMWELPLRLAAMLDDYDFHVRHYSYGRWECILYAVPRERLP
ncbi:MAG: FkbM family methyltransferase [Deltaproteobacteria bacterium]|nr:FkbM family methyltransferase [Deltaproteobacteria bacterium]